MEHVAASNKHVDTSFNKAWGSFLLYTAIDFDEGFRTSLVNQFAQALNFLNGVLDELLTTKAWVHTHQQYHVDIRDDILEQRHG